MARFAVTDPNSRVYTAAVWLALAVLAVATVVAGFHETALNASIMGGFLVLLAVVYWWASHLPNSVLAVAAWALAVNAAGWTWNWYQPIWGYDEFSHGLGTAGATLMVAFTCYRPLFPLWRQDPFSVSLAVFVLGVAIGAAWELAEWFGYYFFAGDPSKIFHDIISDLICDSVGALLSVPFGYWAYRDVPY